MMVRKSWAAAADSYPWSSWHEQILGVSGSVPSLAKRISAITKAVISLMSTLPSSTTSNTVLSQHEVALNELLQLCPWKVQLIGFDLIQPSIQPTVTKRYLDLAQRIVTSLLEQENATRISTKLMGFNSRHLRSNHDELEGSRICPLFDRESLASFLVEFNHFSKAKSHSRKKGSALGRAAHVICKPSHHVALDTTNDTCPNPSWADFWIKHNLNKSHVNRQAPRFFVDICWHDEHFTGSKQPYIRASGELQGFMKQILSEWPGEQVVSSAHLIQAPQVPSISIHSSGSGSQSGVHLGHLG